jgi:hypothetical protein
LADLVLAVSEPKPFRLLYGGLYDSGNGPGFIADLQNHNSLGAGRTLGPRVEEGSPATSPADAVVKMVDQKITDHVAALTRAYTALDTAHAAEIGLDDSAARSVDAAGETLEDVSRALVEIKTS